MKPYVRNLAVLLSAPALFVGCSGGEMAVDEIISRVQASQAEIESVHVVADIAMQGGLSSAGDDAIAPWLTDDQGAEPMETSIEQWIAGDKLRLEYKDGLGGMEGTVMVVNGDTMAMYMPTTNTFFTTDVPDIGSESASPVQAAAMTREWVSRILETHTVLLAGTDEVAARRTFHLKAVPKTASGDNAPSQADEDGLSAADTSEMWVDTETFYPLKMSLAMGPVHVTITTREIEYNPVIPPEFFSLEAPEGAETADFDLPEFETTTVDEASEQVDFDLVEADPDATDFVLQDTTVSAMPGFRDDLRIVVQTYRGPSGTITVQQLPAASGMDLAAGMQGQKGVRTVRVGDRDATLLSMGIAGATLTWQEGDTAVIVGGQVLEDTLLEFAASLH